MDILHGFNWPRGFQGRRTGQSVAARRFGLGANEWVGGHPPLTPSPFLVGIWAFLIRLEGRKTAPEKGPGKVTFFFLIFKKYDCNKLK